MNRNHQNLKIQRGLIMVKPYFDKEKGKYCVKAFGEIHEFDEILDSTEILQPYRSEYQKPIDFLRFY